VPEGARIPEFSILKFLNSKFYVLFPPLSHSTLNGNYVYFWLLKSEISHVFTRSFQSRPVDNERAARRAWLVANLPDGLDRPFSVGPFLYRSK
jgi:hypothetical protein